MKFYLRLTRSTYQGAAIALKKAIPELKHCDIDHIERCLNNTNLEFFKTEKKAISMWIRLSLPFAFIAIVLLFLYMPINFMVTGRWGYNIIWIKNWLNRVGF